MSVSITTDLELHEITIAVAGHFDFRLVSDFRRAYDAIENPKKVTVDFEHTDYIDSSGLGILIYLRKHFNCSKDSIFLINTSSDINRTFRIARFNKLFQIS